ncbi:GuaB1 family IMP dehydrogenase-related protein [uncultured Micrococcus sp.]|uniref:GMP reductase n=1 Tax=uncultured Micrococcus sp. TaxID=114051 RepID=UPI00259AC53E|nr:GuaB1 family IMP dehydrogenase-related protein [uncultured Micrococcus sp.]
MRFLTQPVGDLTYADVFLVPSHSTVSSRMDVDIRPDDGTGGAIPLVAANMTAVSGRRMLETMARRGGLGVLPQDLDIETVAETTRRVKASHPVLDTPSTVSPSAAVVEALHLFDTRGHAAVCVVDEDGNLLGTLGRDDCEGVDRFAAAGSVMSSPPLLLHAEDFPSDRQDGSVSPERARAAFDAMTQAQVEYAPVVRSTVEASHDGEPRRHHGRLVGAMTTSGAVRSAVFTPTVDEDGALRVGAAIGINGPVREKAQALIEAGVDVLVVDTAHGHQRSMLEALAAVRSVDPPVPVVAGNVVTAEGVRDLVSAGADIVKVGVGPGAMCTTRMMTAVGRPQFSAVLECAAAAGDLGRHVWADGGVKHPRDAALALAAGASQVMIGSWFAGTLESPGDVVVDPDGSRYKISFGMASARAVQHRTRHHDAFSRARTAMFEEGVSSSRMYIDPQRPSVEDLIDAITSGVRSSLAYAGATTLAQFRERAVVGVQSAAGYEEGRPVSRSW